MPPSKFHHSSKGPNVFNRRQRGRKVLRQVRSNNKKKKDSPRPRTPKDIADITELLRRRGLSSPAVRGTPSPSPRTPGSTTSNFLAWKKRRSQKRQGQKTPIGKSPLKVDELETRRSGPVEIERACIPVTPVKPVALTEEFLNALGGPTPLSRRDSVSSNMSEISVISTASSRSILSEGDGPERQATVYLLTELSSLVDEIQPGSLVGLDLDETLVVTRHTPSLLLTTKGVEVFQKYVHKRFKDFATKNNHCRQLQAALQDKVLVTPDTGSVVRQLQDKGCFVFGLTARYSEMATVTERTLHSVGIDLARTSPFPPQILDPQSESLCQNGIIYCSNQPKGWLLRRYLQAFVFREVLATIAPLEAEDVAAQQYAMDQESDEALPDVLAFPSAEDTGPSAAVKAALSKMTLPAEVVFVDDLYANAHGVSLELEAACVKRLGVGVSCYHYVPANLAELQASAEERLDEATYNSILTKQMEVFVSKGLVLTNHQARVALGSSYNHK